MKLWYKIIELPLRTKLLLSYAALLSITGVLIGIGSFYIATDTINKDYKYNTAFVLEAVFKNVTYQTHALEREVFLQCSNTSMYQSELFYFREGNRSSVNIQNDLSWLLTANRFYDYIFFFDADERLYFSTRDGAEDLSLRADEYLQYQTVLTGLWGRSRWYAGKSGIELQRAFYDNSGRYVGCLFIGISDRFFQNVFSGAGSEDYLISYGNPPRMMFATLPNDSTLRLESNQPISLDTASSTLTLEGQSYMISRTEADNWQLLHIISTADLLSKVYTQAILIVVVCLLTFFLTWGVAAAVSQMFARRVNLLVHGMDKAACGHLKQRVSIGGSDEIQQIAQSFNALMDQLEVQLEHVKAEQAHKERIRYDFLKFKYQTLQSELNPHLMYNVLDSICSMAKLNHQPQIADSVYLLSHVLRQTIQQKSILVTLQHELSFTENYLQLYQFIYGNRFVFETRCNFDSSGYEVPSLVLQPIVENAIKHGIEACHGSLGILLVDCKRVRDFLVIRIYNNGPCIPKEKKQQLTAMLHTTIHSTQHAYAGIGLLSVKQRLALLYNGTESIQLLSGSTHSTLVKIKLPCTRPASLDESEHTPSPLSH